MNAILFSICLRNIIICLDAECRDRRQSEMKELLLASNYPEQIINSAIIRAKSITREAALETNCSIFAVQFDPCLPGIQSIQAKH